MIDYSWFTSISTWIDNKINRFTHTHRERENGERKKRIRSPRKHSKWFVCDDVIKWNQIERGISTGKFCGTATHFAPTNLCTILSIKPILLYYNAIKFIWCISSGWKRQQLAAVLDDTVAVAVVPSIFRSQLNHFILINDL